MAQEVGHALVQAVGAGGAEGEQVAGRQLRQAHLAQAVQTGAEGAGQGVRHGARALAHGLHGEGLACEQGPDEVVDAALQDGEAGAAALLDPHHPGQVEAAGPRQEAAGLEDELALEPGVPRQQVGQSLSKSRQVQRRFIRRVGHAQAAPQVDLLEG